jgi:hypothetical protein
VLVRKLALRSVFLNILSDLKKNVFILIKISSNLLEDLCRSLLGWEFAGVSSAQRIRGWHEQLAFTVRGNFFFFYLELVLCVRNI